MGRRKSTTMSDDKDNEDDQKPAAKPKLKQPPPTTPKLPPTTPKTPHRSSRMKKHTKHYGTVQEERKRLRQILLDVIHNEESIFKSQTASQSRFKELKYKIKNEDETIENLRELARKTVDPAHIIRDPSNPSTLKYSDEALNNKIPEINPTPKASNEQTKPPETTTTLTNVFATTNVFEPIKYPTDDEESKKNDEDSKRNDADSKKNDERDNKERKLTSNTAPEEKDNDDEESIETQLFPLTQIPAQSPNYLSEDDTNELTDNDDPSIKAVKDMEQQMMQKFDDSMDDLEDLLKIPTQEDILTQQIQQATELQTKLDSRINEGIRVITKINEAKQSLKSEIATLHAENEQQRLEYFAMQTKVEKETERYDEIKQQTQNILNDHIQKMYSTANQTYTEWSNMINTKINKQLSIFETKVRKIVDTNAKDLQETKERQLAFIEKQVRETWTRESNQMRKDIRLRLTDHINNKINAQETQINAQLEDISKTISTKLEEMEVQLQDQVDTTANEATSLLDQTLMHLQDEMVLQMEKDRIYELARNSIQLWAEEWFQNQQQHPTEKADQKLLRMAERCDSNEHNTFIQTQSINKIEQAVSTMNKQIQQQELLKQDEHQQLKKQIHNDITALGNELSHYKNSWTKTQEFHNTRLDNHWDAITKLQLDAETWESTHPTKSSSMEQPTQTTIQDTQRIDLIDNQIMEIRKKVNLHIDPIESMQGDIQDLENKVAAMEHEEIPQRIHDLEQWSNDIDTKINEDNPTESERSETGQFEVAQRLKRNEQVQANLRHFKKDVIHHTITRSPTQNDMEMLYRSIYSSMDSFALPIRKLEDLEPRGTTKTKEQTIDTQLETRVSNILYRKLMEIIPDECNNLKAILATNAGDQDGYTTLYSMMRMHCPYLQDIPKTWGPQWKPNTTAFEYLVKLNEYLYNEEKSNGKFRSTYQTAAEILQQASMVPAYQLTASTYLVMLLQHSTHQQKTPETFHRTRLVNILEAQKRTNIPTPNFEEDAIHINKAQGPQKGDRRPFQYKNPKQCPACKTFGHDIQSQICRIAAQIHHVQAYQQDNKESTLQNAMTWDKSNDKAKVNKIKTLYPALFPPTMTPEEEIEQITNLYSHLHAPPTHNTMDNEQADNEQAE
jgi:hypothetical protein